MAVLNRNKKETVSKNVLPHILDIISPTVIDFEPKKMIVGDLFQRALVVIDYPSHPNMAWLSRAANLPGVTASIHIEPTDPHKLINDIRISMGELEGKLITGGNPFYLKQTSNKLKDTEKLLDKIDREQQKVLDVTVIFLVTATDVEMLEQRTKKLEAVLAANSLRARTPLYAQKEALRSVGPWRLLEEDIKAIGARNMPAISLAASFPFTYSGINDESGILLGIDESGGIVLLDIWKRDQSRTNSNMIVMGKPGVGKSTLIKKILRGEYGRGTKIIQIDPEREYKDLCENVNGDWVDCGGGSGGRINPLQVREVPLDDEEEKEKLYDRDVVKRGPLALHFQTLRTFFQLYQKSFQDDDMLMAYLERVLIETYNKKDIYWDTDPKDIRNEDWPIIKDVYDKSNEMYQETNEEEYKKVATLLESAAIGADSYLWNGHTTLNANSSFIVLDINNLLEADSRILKAQFFNVLGWTWNEASRDRTEKVLLGCDEAYLLADPVNTQPLQFLRNTNKRIRKYEGGLLVITHNLVDFLSPEVRRFGQSLIDNPSYKILMGQGENDIEALTHLMTLSQKEVQILSDGIRGKALLVAGNRRLETKIRITSAELRYFGNAGGR